MLLKIFYAVGNFSMRSFGLDEMVGLQHRPGIPFSIEDELSAERVGPQIITLFAPGVDAEGGVVDNLVQLFIQGNVFGCMLSAQQIPQVTFEGVLDSLT